MPRSLGLFAPAAAVGLLSVAHAPAREAGRLHLEPLGTGLTRLVL
jgi:hypothetical protein